MSTLKDLLEQQAALNQKIEELRLEEHQEAVTKAKELIALYNLTQDELFGNTAKEAKVKGVSKVAAKYQDPISNKTWSGRGIAPKWIAESGKGKESFLISK